MSHGSLLVGINPPCPSSSEHVLGASGNCITWEFVSDAES